MSKTNDTYDIVPPHLVVEAMRDNGYKNATYAIAELMDNAIQAGAKEVELLCAEEEVLIGTQKRKRIKQIAVLDNGCGMDSDVLRIALQFGNGTRLETGKKEGIGRFGMGLPSSSISQCKKVEVWTWQNGIENAIYSYLDIDEIKKDNMTTVPEPIPKPIPDIWGAVGKGFSSSGTLVVWSRIDRCMWKTAAALIRNSELLVGRIYRKFLDSGDTKIRMVSFTTEENRVCEDSIEECYARPNDPGYLMENTSCPKPFDKTPMFEPWGEHYELVHSVNFRGEEHDVIIRFSIAKPTARSSPNAGSLPHGKHANKNTGVSIVRAGRELDLDQGVVNGYDTRERWWGVEVEFPPALDDLFGVTNNKQSARNFSDVLKLDLESITDFGPLMEEWTAMEDPRAPLLRIYKHIDNNLDSMRKAIRAQGVGQRSSRRHDREKGYDAEVVATSHTEKRKEDGYRGVSDDEETLPAEQRKEIIRETLIEDGLSKDDADELVARTLEDNIKYIFQYRDLETSAFFSVKPRGGAIIITLNTQHPAYDNLVDILEQDVDGVPEDELRERLSKALYGLKLLLISWARYEDELTGRQKEIAQDIRNDWGRVARQFLRSDE